jgi:PTH1 family peptidyl-tRNA hydrolase
MALFQRKPQTSSSAPLYTFGLQQTMLIVGLGNTGKEYDLTRHNVGFLCADKLQQALDAPDWTQKKDLKCLLTSVQAAEKRIIIIKPTTFMNLSGEAVQAVMHFYKVPLENVVVIHDELDIPFGQIRTRIGGSSAGHNGIKSVSQNVGEGYGRIRIGISAETKMESADFVLAKFSGEEQKELPNLEKEVTAITTEYIYGGELAHETRSFLI